MKPAVVAKMPLLVEFCRRPLVSSPSECPKINIYTLFSDHFCVFFVTVRYKLCSIRGAEKLLTNLFGHNVKQPSSWLDVNQTLR